MSSNNGSAVAFFGVAVGGAVIWAIIGDVTTALCDGVDLRTLNEGRPVFGCHEFWFNRYQTTIQTILATTVGALGLFFVLRQLEALSHQNEMTRSTLAANTVAQEQATRIALGRAIGAIDAYTFAVFRMIQEVERRRRSGPTRNGSTRKRLIENAEGRRPDIYAVLTSAELRKSWREFEGEFDAIAIFLAETDAGGLITDPTQLRLSKREPAPKDLNEAIVRAGQLSLMLIGLRDQLDR